MQMKPHDPLVIFAPVGRGGIARQASVIGCRPRRASKALAADRMTAARLSKL